MISTGFHRSFDALARIFEFTRRFYDAEGVPAEDRLAFDFCVEEIFTNFVKYNRGNPKDIELALERRGDRAGRAGHRLRRRAVRHDAGAAGRRELADRAAVNRGGWGCTWCAGWSTTSTYDYTNRQSRITVTRNLR